MIAIECGRTETPRQITKKMQRNSVTLSPRTDRLPQRHRPRRRQRSPTPPHFSVHPQSSSSPPPSVQTDRRKRSFERWLYDVARQILDSVWASGVDLRARRCVRVLAACLVQFEENSPREREEKKWDLFPRGFCWGNLGVIRDVPRILLCSLRIACGFVFKYFFQLFFSVFVVSLFRSLR